MEPSVKGNLPKGFWEQLKKPIIALAPMDGVTDFACRYITAKHGRPDVLFTEFTNAEGLFYAPEKLLRDFEYHEIERPIVAQIYGHRPEDFYRAAHVVCELGFDGVDINMGCPSKQVTQRCCGAKLITAPDLALEIIRSTRQGIEDWVKGQTLEDLKIPAKVIHVVQKMKQNLTSEGPVSGPPPLTASSQKSGTAGDQWGSPVRSHPQIRKPIPCSVKTRLGYDSVVIERWIETLLGESPAAISIHGRTLKQMYKGSADWAAIGRAVRVAEGSGTLILGNGDINSLEEARQRISETGVDGVLLGRSAIGNPWIFQESQPSVEQRFQVALEHIRHYLQVRGAHHFAGLKKHLSGYLSHFPGASVIRIQAMRTKTAEELISLLEEQLRLQVVNIGNGGELPGPLSHRNLDAAGHLQPGEE